MTQKAADFKESQEEESSSAEQPTCHWVYDSADLMVSKISVPDTVVPIGKCQ